MWRHMLEHPRTSRRRCLDGIGVGETASLDRNGAALRHHSLCRVRLMTPGPIVNDARRAGHHGRYEGVAGRGPSCGFAAHGMSCVIAGVMLGVVPPHLMAVAMTHDALSDDRDGPKPAWRTRRLPRYPMPVQQDEATGKTQPYEAYSILCRYPRSPCAPRTVARQRCAFCAAMWRQRDLMWQCGNNSRVIRADSWAKKIKLPPHCGREN